jgi:hypothetical protein
MGQPSQTKKNKIKTEKWILALVCTQEYSVVPMLSAANSYSRLKMLNIPISTFLFHFHLTTSVGGDGLLDVIWARDDKKLFQRPIRIVHSSSNL